MTAAHATTSCPRRPERSGAPRQGGPAATTGPNLATLARLRVGGRNRLLLPAAQRRQG